MAKAKLSRYDLLAARGLFRSLFMEGWQEHHTTWQEAISKGSLEWAFTATKFREVGTELATLLAYPDAVIEPWLAQICSGLPAGSPDPKLSLHEFITQVKELVMAIAEERERNGNSRRYH